MPAIKIWDIEPLMVGHQTVGQVRDIKVTRVQDHNGESHEYVEGLLGDETGCITFRFAKDKVLEIKKDMLLRVLNFKTQFNREKRDSIFLTCDKFGNVVEDKTAKIARADFSKNVSNENWEPKPEENKE